MIQRVKILRIFNDIKSYRILSSLFSNRGGKKRKEKKTKSNDSIALTLKQSKALG